MLYVGQLIERKGLGPFMRSLGQWAEGHSQQCIEFWVVGDGPMRTVLQKIATPKNLAVKFFGNVPYGSLPSIYAQAGICVLPTLADTWALVVNEALSSGLPVLGSVYSQAVEQLVRDGENGWTYRPDAPGQTKQALDRALLADTGKLSRMREAARESVSWLTPEYAAAQFIKAVALARSGAASLDRRPTEAAVRHT